jgi:F-type H+-transporting ATPase subunit delta
MKAVELRRLAGAVGKTLHKAGEPLDALALFARLFREHPAALALLQNPSVPPDRRDQALRGALDRAGAPPASRAVLESLARTFTLAVLPDLLALLEAQALRRRGVLPLTVEVAAVPAEAERAAIERCLKRLLKQDLKVDYAVRPSLLGGFVARSESYFVDASLEGRVRAITSLEEPCP